MSSTTAEPGDSSSASLPELAAAEASELDGVLGGFAALGFLEARWSLSAPAESGCAPSAPGLRIWPPAPSCAGLRFVGVCPGACRETMRRASLVGHEASAPWAA